jgi:hypothetical protein
MPQTRSKHLEALIQSVKDEWKGTFRKFPDLAIFAVQDEQVGAAIERRFKKEAGISAVRQLEYNFHTGLHNLVFEFAPRLADLGTRPANAFLAIVDGNGKVIAVVDPFDPVQPNKFVPPLPTESEQPFVLARPSVTAEVNFTDQDMYPVQVRNRAFFQRISVGGSGVMGGDVEIYTKCAYTTRTPSDYWTDYQNDDCGLPDDILA